MALGAVIRWGSNGLARDDRASVGFAVVLVLLATGVPAYTAYQTSFAEPQAESNPLVQYAQPSAAGVTVPSVLFPALGIPIDVAGRLQLNEVAVNHAADEY